MTNKESSTNSIGSLIALFSEMEQMVKPWMANLEKRNEEGLAFGRRYRRISNAWIVVFLVWLSLIFGGLAFVLLQIESEPLANIFLNLSSELVGAALTFGLITIVWSRRESRLELFNQINENFRIERELLYQFRTINRKFRTKLIQYMRTGGTANDLKRTTEDYVVSMNTIITRILSNRNKIAEVAYAFQDIFGREEQRFNRFVKSIENENQQLQVAFSMLNNRLHWVAENIAKNSR